MPRLDTLMTDDLRAFRHQAGERHAAFRARGLKLDSTRGKPSGPQLDLSNALLDMLGGDDFRSADGGDCRNYLGDVRGLPEARALFAPVLGAPVEQMLVGGNSSLTLMHDLIVFALLHGVPGGDASWSTPSSSTGAPVTFLCPVPGYDRHFGICEGFGIRMIPVPLTGHGPDMDVVERLVAEDPSVKGIWCVPKYSNPTGETYSDETVERLAAMPTAAPDFRLFWDNAYVVHHLADRPHRLANILEACARHGHPDRAFIFGSTSKVTFAGAGLSLFAGSTANLDWARKHLGRQSIGPDKLNQLRHVRLLRDEAGIAALMERHRQILVPKFQRVQAVFTEHLGGTGVARWTEPEGGYFISLDVRDRTARRVVTLSQEAGVAMVAPGATFPYGRDPNDRNIRIAPTFPPLEEVGLAAEGVALSVLVAASEAILAEREAGGGH
jgi:DNA-binding transcriptional MocR family regulator